MMLRYAVLSFGKMTPWDDDVEAVAKEWDRQSREYGTLAVTVRVYNDKGMSVGSPDEIAPLYAALTRLRKGER